MHFDPLFVLAALMIGVSLWGFGFQAGLNKARRDERVREAIRRKYQVR